MQGDLFEDLGGDEGTDPSAGKPGSGITTHAGSRSTESALIDAVRDQVQRAREDRMSLGRPVVVLVSSGTLRSHVAARLVESIGPSLVGIRVETLWSFARSLLIDEDLGWEDPGAVFEMLARRSCAAESTFADVLGKAGDALGMAAASLRDLISAGFSEEHLEACLERLAELPRDAVRDRAEALLHAGSRLLAEQARARILRPGDLAQRAAEALRRGSASPRTRAILIHGFADATGQSADLIRTLLERNGARLFVNLAPDPSSPQGPSGSTTEVEDRGTARFGSPFVRGFLDRLGHAVPDIEPESADPPPQFLHFHASGVDAEVRELARRVSESIEGGRRPERIAVVARRLDGHALAIRRAFHDLGVPFSGGAAPVGLRASERSVSAALEVLESGADATFDPWFDAQGPASPWQGPGREDLRLALRVLGVARLSDFEALDLERTIEGRDALPLPVRRGSHEEDAEPTEREDPSEVDPSGGVASTQGGLSRTRRPRRSVAVDRLVEAHRSISAALEHLRTAPVHGDLGTGLAWVRVLLVEHLGWSESTPKGDSAPWVSALGGFEGQHGLSVHGHELIQLVRSVFENLTREDLGGQGGGVQVLDATQARGSCFEEVYLAGLERGSFPRGVREDPLLPDRIRRSLGVVLPDLRPKQDGHEEERYLFAEICSSAEVVTLSRQRSDSDGRVRGASPFLERLLEGRGDLEPVAVPRLAAERLSEPWCGGPGRPRTAEESLLAIALSGRRSEWAGFARLALEADAGGLEAGELGKSRAAILAEFEEPGGEEEFLGPYLGRIHAAAPGAEDSLAEDSLFVTTVESYARCPWQSFLRKELGLEPVPDPLAAMPGITPLMVGNVVHRSLEALVLEGMGDGVGGAAGSDLGTALSRALLAFQSGAPRPLERPKPIDVERHVRAVAREVAIEEGIQWPGFHRALTRYVRPYVDRAIEIDFADPEQAKYVVGVELYGHADVEGEDGSTRRLRFQVDRVDFEAGVPVLVDYKTGTVYKEKREPNRERKLIADIRAGSRLQALAYTDNVASRDRPDVRAEYYGLKPEHDLVAAKTSVHRENPELAIPRRRTLPFLLSSRSAGAFPPRLEGSDGQEPRSCATCEVSEACLRGDSGIRERLVSGVQRVALTMREGGNPVDSHRQYARLWYLGEEERFLESPPPEDTEASEGGAS